MDISMPVMDGLQATQHIRSYEQSTKVQATYIVGLTAHTNEEYKNDCLDQGMNEFSK